MSEIDVSKCRYYMKYYDEVIDETPAVVPPYNLRHENYCLIHKKDCSYSDCYYKQLQRLKTENENLKKELHHEITTFMGKHFDYWKELEIMAEKINALEFLNMNAKLRAENEELKEMYRLSCLKCKFKNAFMVLDEIVHILEINKKRTRRMFT